MSENDMSRSQLTGLCPHGNFAASCSQCQAEQRAPGPDLEALVAELSAEKLSPQERKELVAAAWAAMRDEFVKAGAVYVEDVNELVRELPDNELLVRREAPERVIAAIKDHANIKLAQDTEAGRRYANASLWSPKGDQSGLINAWTEGRAAAGGIATVLGFDKNGLSVERVAGHQQVGNTSRHLVRGVEGEIGSEDVRFIMVGIPAALFPETELTDREQELIDDGAGDPKKLQAAGARRIIRGFRFGGQSVKGD